MMHIHDTYLLYYRSLGIARLASKYDTSSPSIWDDPKGLNRNTITQNHENIEYTVIRINYCIFNIFVILSDLITIEATSGRKQADKYFINLADYLTVNYGRIFTELYWFVPFFFFFFLYLTLCIDYIFIFTIIRTHTNVLL
jgi:hypothetical protein